MMEDKNDQHMASTDLGQYYDTEEHAETTFPAR